MADTMEDDQHKCLVIVNESNTDIILYIYSGWTPFAKVCTISKIIKPNQKYFYHEKTPFKFKIVSKSLNDEKPKNLLGLVEWNEDKEITITESLDCLQKKLAEIENRRKLCLRKIHREEELTPAAGMPNFYNILGLDMEEERKKNKEDAKKAIEKAYRKQMLIWHPDKNFGDVEIAMQINRAKECLMDDAKRARYHNDVDYDEEWFSMKRSKAIFSSDTGNEKQEEAFWRRIRSLIPSVTLATGGIVLSIFTAGAAAPEVVTGSGIIGAGLTGAGFQSLGHTVSKKFVLDECDFKSSALKVVIGGAAVGFTGGMVGIGSAAIESGAVTAGQYVGMGTATGAVGGVTSSLSSDAAKVLVDKEKVTAKQYVGRDVSRGLIGAAAGAPGGLVTKGIVDSQASAATSTLEGDAVEHFSALTGGRRLACTNESEDDERKCLVIVNESNADIILYIYSESTPSCVFFTFSKIIQPNKKYFYHEETPFKFEIASKSLNEKKAKNLLGPVEWNEDKEITITESLECLQIKLAEIENGRQLCLRKKPREEELTSGGAAVGNAAGMVSIGSAAMESSFVTAGQYVGMETATGAAGGVISSLSSDAAKILVDKENVKAKQVVGCAVSEGLIGAGAGAVGGLVTKGIVDSQASVATSTLEGDAVEQVSTLTGGRRLANTLAHTVSKQVTISGTKAMLGTASKVVEERLDDFVENQNITKHAKSGVENTVVDVVQSAGFYTAGGCAGHGINEATLDEQSNSRNATSKEPKAESYLNSNETHENIHGLGNETNEVQGAGEENSEPSSGTNEEQEVDEQEENMAYKQFSYTVNEERKQSNETGKPGNQSNNANMNESESGRSHATIEKSAPEPDDQCYEEHCKSTQENPHVVGEESRANTSSNGETYEENREPSDETDQKQKADEPLEVMIKYISKGAWVSKMTVTYDLNGKECEPKEVSGDGKRVYISADAINVKVRFQVMRSFWGDIKKYDRFKGTWCKPSEAHIFHYEKAVDRTFTLSGPLWYEAVMRVSDEHHEETMEMK